MENKFLKEIEEKKRLEEILKKMCPKSESEQKLEIMKLLHEYNSVKDAAQMLFGALARQEGVTVKEIHERFNLHDED